MSADFRIAVQSIAATNHDSDGYLTGNAGSEADLHACGLSYFELHVLNSIRYTRLFFNGLEGPVLKPRRIYASKGDDSGH